jgi:hypothetical protein
VDGTRLTPKSVYREVGECFNFAEISALELETKGTQLSNGHALLINSLVDFNFRRPLLLEFPGEQFASAQTFAPPVFHLLIKDPNRSCEFLSNVQSRLREKNLVNHNN